MANTFQLLHIGDLFAKNNLGETFDRSFVVDSLIEQVQKDRRQGIDPNVIVISGAIAYGGKKEEYESARVFLDALLMGLNMEKERLFLVPGARDIDQTKYRPKDIPSYETMRELNAELENEAYREDLLKGMGEYFDFVREYLPHLKSIQGKLVPFVNIIEHASPAMRIALVGLNSAWMCRRDVAPGNVAIGEYQVKVAMNEIRKSGEVDLQIILVHHPLASLWAPDRMLCKSYLKRSVLLCTNLSDSESCCVHDFDGSLYQITAKNRRVENGLPWPGCFQYVMFDWKAGVIKLDFRTYLDERRRWIIDTAKGDEGTTTVPMLVGHPEVDAAARIPVVEKQPQFVNQDENIRNYTQCAVNAHRHLSTAGFEAAAGHPLELERVYVPMQAYVHFKNRDGCLEKWTEDDGTTEDNGFPTVDIPRAFAASARHSIKDVVLLGGPGSGKTTVLKHLLLSLIEGGGAKSLGLDSGTIPFFASLKNLEDPDRESFADFIRRECRLDTFSVSDASFKELLHSGRGIILLDGLDEVVDKELRSKTCRWIDRARHEYASTRFVMTSRFSGYLDQCRLEGNCLELYLSDFLHQDVESFLLNWFETVEVVQHIGDNEERWRHKGTEAAQRLFKTIQDAESLKRLAANPLMLQIMAVVYRDCAGALPQRRIELYEQCLTVLLEKWDTAKGLEPLLTAHEACQVLQPLAMWLHTEEDRRSAPLEDISEIIQKGLDRIGKSQITPKALLHHLRDRSGIIEMYGDREYGFFDVTFQEYLAAQEIHTTKNVAILVDNYGRTWWDEVTLLSTALNGPTVFPEFLERVILTESFSDNPELVLKAYESAQIKPIKPIIQAVLNDELPPETRYNALRALKQNGGPKAIETLRTCVESEDQTLARIAFEALESLGAAQGVISPEPEEDIVKRSAPAVDERSGSELLVPAGPFLYGSSKEDMFARSDEKPQRTIDLPDYYIDEFPVTNEQFCQFLNASLPGEELLREWIDLEGEFMRERCRIRKRKGRYWCEKGYDRHPVIYVSWYGAKEYASWAGKRLPTEQEWEKAARGTDGRLYPWGDEFDRSFCNTKEGGLNSTSPVDRFPKGKSLYGCYDMAGNVWEWTSSFFDEEEDRMAVRGGSWLLNQALARCAARVRTLPYDWYLSLGFRCVRDAD